MMIYLLIAIMFMIIPAAAQYSGVFLCLQRMPPGLSIETMLEECQPEVSAWMAECSLRRAIDVCSQAVTEEAEVAARYSDMRGR
jgi:hypothetical protein